MQNLYVPGTIVFTDRVCLYLENVQLNSLPMTLINKSYFSLTHSLLDILPKNAF